MAPEVIRTLTYDELVSLYFKGAFDSQGEEVLKAAFERLYNLTVEMKAAPPYTLNALYLL